MKTWNERLAFALKESTKNAAWLAEAVGVKPASVSDWLSGETKTLKAINANRICSALGLNISWLLDGKKPVYSKDIPEIEKAGYVPIPFQNVELRATNDALSGFEIQFEEDSTIKPLYYRRDWISKHGYRVESLAARKVSGSSMEPALYDGDKVLINLDSRKPKNGTAFAVLIEGHPCIKRLRKRGSEWWITSDNPAHSNSDLPLENEQQIIGEAVEKTSNNI